MKVKCAFCHKEIDKKEAIAVLHGKRNRYFCSKEHIEKNNERDEFYYKAKDIFGNTTNTMFYKELDQIGSIHGFKKMLNYLNTNESYLRNILARKQYKSEYGKIRYFATILKNSLGDFVETTIKNDYNKVVDHVDIYEIKFKKDKERRGMDELLSSLV